MVPVVALNDPRTKAHFSFHSPETEVPLDLGSLGNNPEQEPVDRPGGFPGYHWLQTDIGHGEVTIGPRRFILGPRQGVLLPPGLPHSYVGIDWPWSTRYLTFGGPVAEILVSSVGIPTSTVFTWESKSPLQDFLTGQTDGLRAGSWGTPWSRSAIVYGFLTHLKEHGRPLGPRSASVADLSDRLGPLFEFIEAKLDDPDLGVDAMAGFLGVSPRHLNELFGRIGSRSPYQYLKDRRIARARQLLWGSRDMGVKAISHRVGFRDPSHFIQTFRRAVGKSPDQFRRTLV